MNRLPLTLCLLLSAPAAFAGAAVDQLSAISPQGPCSAAVPPRPAPVFTARSGAPAASLRYSPLCILKAVAALMGQQYRPDIPLPAVFRASEVTLLQFQDAVEPQWGLRPDNITNVYVWNRAEIYLMDDAAWYAEQGRAMDDSLAHEFVHYIQYRYRGWDLSQDDPGLEWQAIEFQTRFREEFIQKPGVCPA